MRESEAADRLLTVEAETELANRLMQCVSIRKLDDPRQLEGPAIADALSDLENIFRKYLNELLPRVLTAPTCEALEDALADIRGEFQEIVWHLWYPKFFRSALLGQDCHPDFIDTSLRP